MTSNSNCYNEYDIQQFWNDNNIFDKSIENNQDKPIFVFYDGPPFATGLPHYGHILAGFIKDTIGRFQTQNGYYVPRNAGWDCHGLPIEYEIEKEHKIKTKQQIEDWGIDNYNNACKSIVMKYSFEWKSIMNRLGRWVDFDNDYKTMDFDFMNSVWWVFAQLYKKGLVYPSYKVLPYSVACKTPLSNFETQQNYQEVEDITIFVKFELIEYKFNDNLVNLLVWTTTPWTLPSNLLIAINKETEYVLTANNNEYYIIAKNLVDKLNKQNKKNELEIIQLVNTEQLIGQKYKPLFDCYPIDQLNKPTMAHSVVHGDFVTDSDGTGLVHIAPSYGDEDYQLCIKTQIICKIDELFMSIDDDGYFKDLPNLSELKGIYYKINESKESKESNNGNSIIIDLLKQTKKLFFQNRIKHNYPFCWRSDTPLMYRAIKSWFVNVESIKNRMVELNKTINWYPKFVGEKRFHEWLSDARDWCIARNRYWGTPLPIWINTNDSSDYIIINSAQELSDLTKENITDLHRDKIDHLLIKKDGQTYKRTTEIFDCIAEGSEISLANGRSIEIQNFNIYNNDVMSFENTKNYKNITKSKCVAFMEKGIQNCIELIFEDGRILQCTPNHKVLIKSNDEYIWIEAKNININEHRIVTSVSYPKININCDLNPWSLQCGNLLLKYDTFENKIKSNTFARLLGYILTDGSFQNHTTAGQISGTYFVANILDAEMLVSDIELLCGIKPNINYNLRSNIYIIYTPKQLLQAFLSLDGIQIGRRINQISQLPSFLLDKNNKCPSSLISEFLSGIFGGDGIAPQVKSETTRNGTKTYKYVGINFIASKTEAYINTLQTTFNEISEMLKLFNINSVTISNKYETTSSKKNNNQEKKYQLLLQITDDNDIINFHKYIGFSYCSSKQFKLELCTSWRKMKQFIRKKYNDIITIVIENMSLGLDINNAYNNMFLLLNNNDDYKNYMLSYNQVKKCLNNNNDVSKCYTNVLLKDWLVSLDVFDIFFGENKNTYIVNNNDKHLPSYNLLVIGKKNIGPKNVFDISVDNTHSFLVNGMIVHNCWFESGSMPCASIGYPNSNNKLIMPANFIAEGIDQTRGWFYTLLVISTALFDKVPFQNVIVNGLIMTSDPDTKKPVKMSKRLKNYPDPLNIVNEYGSDALRLYLLNSPATRGDKLVFSEDGVKKIVKEVFITLNNSLSFLLEYEHIISLNDVKMELYNVDNYTTINPLDAYAIKYIGQTIDKIKLYLNSYDIPKAIDMINQFVEMLSNQFIKFNRQSLKGKNDNESWLNSISTLHILLEYFAIVSASLIPFYAEFLFKKLNKKNILSVHLTQFEDFKLPTLTEFQYTMADEMLHILEIIRLVNKIRSKNGLNMKTPLKEIIIESTKEIIDIISKYDSFILDELNVLSYKTKTFDISNVDITLRPNFITIKQNYGDKIKLIENTIKKIETKEQKLEIFCGNTINIDGVEIDSSLCNIIVEPIKMELYYSEYDYKNNTNYSIYLNSIIDDEVLAIGYAKTIASKYQKMRRDAGLHQWNKIKLAFQGKPKYDIEEQKLNNVIYTTCGYQTERMININEDTIILKSKLETDDVTLYLLNPIKIKEL